MQLVLRDLAVERHASQAPAAAWVTRRAGPAQGPHDLVALERLQPGEPTPGAAQHLGREIGSRRPATPPAPAA